MYPTSSVTNYDNFRWTYHGGDEPWYILSGARKSSLNNNTMNVANEFRLSLNGSLFQLAQPSKKSWAKGTLNIHGDAYIENGASLNGALPVGSDNSSAEAYLNIDGTLYVNGGNISGGYTSLGGSGTFTAVFNLHDVFIGNGGAWNAPDINNANNRFNFTANATNITVEEGGRFNAHNSRSELNSTIHVSDTFTVEKGASVTNYAGLVVGSKQDNRLSIGKTLNLEGGSISDRSSLIQSSGLINVTYGNYDFSNFVQTDGQLLNSGNLSFNGADVETKGSLVNYGTLSFSGKSDIDKVISGTGVFNVTGGSFTGVNVDGASSANFSQGATARVDRLNTFVITNGANLSVGDLVQYIGATYTQTAGQISVDSEWFQDSTLNIQGGTLKRDNVGRNTVNLSGGKVEVATLTNDNRYNLSGGELKTDIEQVFYDLKGTTPEEVKYIGLNSNLPQKIQTSLTEWFQTYLPGKTHRELLDFISFQGGKVVVTNANLTTTQRDDLTTAFKETFFIRFPKAFPQLSALWLWA